ncbi:MAG: hypothetical protein VKI82_15970 [Leptolyngbya sp.]|nr:hypothetical protein [Leptolyngbya sp.]
MSAAEKNPWPESPGNEVTPPGTEATKAQAERPTLIAPPPRPVLSTPPKPPAKPAAAKPSPVTPPAKPAAEVAPVAPAVVDPEAYRNQPIAPPSEPMQYRAIGLVRGTYTPTEADQINRGNLVTEDGVIVDAVLLGRVTSLVKKHIDLAVPHLWVVYPRTRRELETEDDQDLHFQIVGVWEPETLGLPGESPQATGSDEDAEAEEPTAAPEPGLAKPATSWPAVEENVFSIRGEVLKCDPEQGLITVKIVQGIKRTPGGAKSFKLTLNGQIEGRTVGYFWDFQVKRDTRVLAVETASVVGIVPPKKRAKGSPGKRPGGRSPGGPRAGASAPRKAAGSPRPKKGDPHRVTPDQEASE